MAPASGHDMGLVRGAVTPAKTREAQALLKMRHLADVLDHLSVLGLPRYAPGAGSFPFFPTPLEKEG
jgi:hypothetical protein